MRYDSAALRRERAMLRLKKKDIDDVIDEYYALRER